MAIHGAGKPTIGLHSSKRRVPILIFAEVDDANGDNRHEPQLKRSDSTPEALPHQERRAKIEDTWLRGRSWWQKSDIEASVKYFPRADCAHCMCHRRAHHEIAITPRQFHSVTFGRGPCAMNSERDVDYSRDPPRRTWGANARRPHGFHMEKYDKGKMPHRCRGRSGGDFVGNCEEVHKVHDVT